MIDHAADLNVKRAHLRHVVWKGPWDGIAAGQHVYNTRAEGQPEDYDLLVAEAVSKLLRAVHDDIRNGRKITRWIDELTTDHWVEDGMLVAGAYAKAMRSPVCLTGCKCDFCKISREQPHGDNRK